MEVPPCCSGPASRSSWWISSELEQGRKRLADADVQGLIDHHRLGTLITRGPDAWIRAVGCSATVLLDLMGHDALSRAQARLLLGPSVSDTFNFTSHHHAPGTGRRSSNCRP